MLVGSGTTVNGLDVLVIHADSRSGVFDDLVPLAHGAVAGSSVGVENGIGLAEDSLGVKVDGLVVSLIAVGLVAGLLELGGVLFALLLGQVRD